MFGTWSWPVLGEHGKALQQDRNHGLVQVCSGWQRLQVHLLLRHLVCICLLVLNRPLRSNSKACWESASTFSSHSAVCVCFYLDVVCQAELCVRVFRHLQDESCGLENLRSGSRCDRDWCQTVMWSVKHQNVENLLQRFLLKVFTVTKKNCRTISLPSEHVICFSDRIKAAVWRLMTSAAPTLAPPPQTHLMMPGVCECACVLLTGVCVSMDWSASVWSGGQTSSIRCLFLQSDLWTFSWLDVRCLLTPSQQSHDFSSAKCFDL